MAPRYGRPAARMPAPGFTLLEMVVAIGIFAVISAVVYPAIQQFVAARDYLNARTAQISGVQHTFLFLENDLRFFVNRGVRDENGEAEQAFFVEDDELIRLTAAYPDMGVFGRSVPKRIAWVFDDAKLVRRDWAVLDRVQDSEPRERLMLEQVEDVVVRFAQRDERELKWVLEWEEDEELPVAIEVSFRLENEVAYRRVFQLPETPTFVGRPPPPPPPGEQGEGDGDQPAEGSGPDESVDAAPEPENG